MTETLPHPPTLAAAALAILGAHAVADKVRLTRAAAAAWRAGEISVVGEARPPQRPARPERPELLPPRAMPKRSRATSLRGRIALLHALAHIELNAIDLAWDLLVRFPKAEWPPAFYDDWVQVADDEAVHFALLNTQLETLGTTYGDLPAHDGLWAAAMDTMGDPLARLAVVPMVLEARALDVTPATIASLTTHGDAATAALLQRIHDDEITHVAAGCRWFIHLSEKRGLDPVSTWHDCLRRHFRGPLKPPFNRDSRVAAGFSPAFWDVPELQGCP